MPDIIAITNITNVVVVVALFLYQRYKLRLLGEAVEEQRRLLTETKEVVLQQATAITSQATVVETALKYSQIFDPKKVEDIVRRELLIDFAREKMELEAKISALEESQQVVARNAAMSAAEIAVDYSVELFTPALDSYVRLLVTFEPHQRDWIIAGIENVRTRALVSRFLATLPAGVYPLPSPDSA